MQSVIVKTSRKLRKRKKNEFVVIQIKVESKRELKMLLKKFELGDCINYPIVNNIPEDSVYKTLVELKRFYKL